MKVENGSRLLTEREAAEYLGVSPRTLWGLRNEGQVRCVKIRRLVKYEVAELERFIESCREAD